MLARPMMPHKPKGRIFSIERYAVHDGEGIRTIVFLKGCPLSCLWCANPEGQDPTSQLLFLPDRCIACGRCVDVCPTGAASRSAEGEIEQRPMLCRGCGLCAAECCSNARSLAGREVDVAEVMAEVARDVPFYRRSGGGLTVSGGEPVAQPKFTAALLAECHRLGISTAVETCGHAPWETLAAIALHLDEVLYDLKHMDPVEHRRLTGVSNELILENLRRLAGTAVEVIVRVPVVTGCNDSESNLAAVADFVAALDGKRRVELLPYHGYGTPKYQRIGRSYSLAGVEPPGAARLQELAGIVRARGVPCEIG